MITVVFSGNENVKNYITGLWQYDFGQVLRIQGLDLPTAVEIHFSLQETEGEAVIRIGTTKDGVTDVVIPDSMLENEDTEMDYNIYVFIYLTDEASGETEKKITLKVKARPKPEAFDTPEDGELFREAIKEVNASADRAEEAEENASKYAAQTKQDAEQTAEDRREVERIVETVSDIGEHVDTVREYRDQAQSAATNALLSEQKTAETKEAVIAAQAGAESAANAAEEYAEQTAQDATQTAEDRAEVALLVEMASDIGEHVQTVKEYKDQAQTAATNALLSESESKKAKEDALLAQAGAESAASAAEQYALEAVGDKTEVERLAAQVRKDKDAVAQSKTSVENTVQNFRQTVQQAKESINTVAAEKVSAVQNAGTQAVQEVTTVKGEAVKAVEDKGVEQVQALEDKGKEIIESFPTAPDLDAKLDKQQGAENAGKALVIGEDGNVVPGEVQTSIEVDATLTKEGEAADAKAVGDKFLRFAIKNTAQGESVVLQDSTEEKLLDLKMQGRTEQETLEGINLFNIEEALNPENWTKHLNYTFTIIAPQAGRFSFSVDENNMDKKGDYETQISNLYFSYTGDNISFGPERIDKKPDTHAFVSTEGGNYRRIYLVMTRKSDAALTREELEILFLQLLKNPQIQKGEQKLPYEPYVGGKPIPNPENPKEIVNAGRRGDNLFNPTSHEGGFYTNASGKVSLNKSTGYSWKMNAAGLQDKTVTFGIATDVVTRFRIYAVDSKYKSIYEYIDSSPNTNDNTHTFIVPKGSREILLSVTEINAANEAVIMLNIGNTRLPYVPYTDKREVDIKLTGKNLFNMEKASDFKNWIAETYAYFELQTKNGKEYTLSFKADSKGEVIWIGIFKATGGAKDAIGLMIWGTTANAVEKKITFTAREHTYIGIYPVGNQGELQQRFTEIINDMQLEEGNVKTDYEPYRGQIVTLSSDRPLTTFDKLEKRDGVWGWAFKTGTLNLADLDVVTVKDDGYTNNLTHRVYREIPDAVANSEAFCNKLYPFAAGDISGIKVADYECFNISNGNYLQMKLLKTRGNTIEQLKAFFAENGMYVLYQSMNEEFVPLSKEEQQLLSSLRTYYPTTIISNNEDCEMQVIYAADTKAYVDNLFLNAASKII